MKLQSLQHEFVDEIPERPVPGILYVSVQFNTAIHTCCSCGEHEVVTPLSPADWSFTYDGAAVSLSPSIGNWSFPCQSHYWIRRNRVDWAATMSRKLINRGREVDRAQRQRYFDHQDDVVARSHSELDAAQIEPTGFLARIARILGIRKQ